MNDNTIKPCFSYKKYTVTIDTHTPLIYIRIFHKDKVRIGRSLNHNYI